MGSSINPYNLIIQQIPIQTTTRRSIFPQVYQPNSKEDKITIRMLLNHSSGIVNFLDLDEFRARQFNDPLNQPTDEELLDMVYKEDQMFEPGTVTYYSNTNYLLLGIILQNITGKS